MKKKDKILKNYKFSSEIVERIEELETLNLRKEKKINSTVGEICEYDKILCCEYMIYFIFIEDQQHFGALCAERMMGRLHNYYTSI